MRGCGERHSVYARVGHDHQVLPLFFGEDLGVSPIIVMVIGALGPLGIAALTLVAARVARVLGRVQTTLLCKASGITFLVLIAFQPTSHVWRIVAMYLVRTWL